MRISVMSHSFVARTRTRTTSLSRPTNSAEPVSGPQPEAPSNSRGYDPPAAAEAKALPALTTLVTETVDQRGSPVNRSSFEVKRILLLEIGIASLREIL